MLHINFVCLIARERQVQPIQLAFFLILQQFLAVQKIRRPMLLPEKQPVPSASAFQNPLLQKGPKRRAPRPRTARENSRQLSLGRAKGSGFRSVPRYILRKKSRLIREKP